MQGWTCLFAYQPIPYLVASNQVNAVIQYTCNPRIDVITYQICSGSTREILENKLVELGYRMELTPADRCIYSLRDMINGCQPTDNYNGISGNYEGYIITLVRKCT